MRIVEKHIERMRTEIGEIMRRKDFQRFHQCGGRRNRLDSETVGFILVVTGQEVQEYRNDKFDRGKIFSQSPQSLKWKTESDGMLRSKGDFK